MTLLALRPRVNRAFERLHRRHAADVYRYALAVLRTPRAAEDVTEGAFLKAYDAFRRGERPSAPRTWLIRFAHEACRERLGQPAASSQAGSGDGDGAEDEIASANDVRAGLERLPFVERLALAMRDLEGRSYGEIATVLGLTGPAAETLVFHGRRRLREQREGPLTCAQAEFGVSRRLDGRLPRGEGAALRAHLGGCADCGAFASHLRAQRAAVRSLGSIPLPASLATFSGGVAGKRGAARAAALLAIGALAGGVSYEGAERLAARHDAVAVAARPAGSARSAVASRAEPSATPRPSTALVKARDRPKRRPQAYRGKPDRRAAAWPRVRVGEK